VALIHEDGTGKADAESLGSVEDADAYWATHGSPASWTDSTVPEKEAALRIGTDAVTQPHDWRGKILRDEQALSHPRVNGVDDEGRLIPSDSVPTRLQAAVFVVANQHRVSPLTAAQDDALRSLRVGPIELEFAGHGGSRSDFDAIVTQVRNLIRPYIVPENRLVRA
jgi:hypothetical protein